MKKMSLAVIATIIPLSASAQQVICEGRLFVQNLRGEGFAEQESVLIFDGAETFLLEHTAEKIGDVPGLGRRDFKTKNLKCSYGDTVCPQSGDELPSYEIKYFSSGLFLTSTASDGDEQSEKLRGVFECLGTE